MHTDQQSACFVSVSIGVHLWSKTLFRNNRIKIYLATLPSEKSAGQDEVGSFHMESI